MAMTFKQGATVSGWMFLIAAGLYAFCGCHWEATLGLGTITAKSDVTIEEWAQANFLKAVDELIAKIPDPNKKDATEGDGEEDEDPATLEHEVPGVEDLGSGGVGGGE